MNYFIMILFKKKNSLRSSTEKKSMKDIKAKLLKIFKREKKEKGVPIHQLVNLCFENQFKILLSIIFLFLNNQFRYADKLDIILIIIGVITALASSAIFPLMFLGYGQAASAFVDYTRDVLNTTNSGPGKKRIFLIRSKFQN